MLPSIVIFYFINCLVISYTCQVDRDKPPVEYDGAEQVGVKSSGSQGPPSGDVDIAELIDYMYVKEGFDKAVLKGYDGRKKECHRILVKSLTPIESWINEQPGVLESYLNNTLELLTRMSKKVTVIISYIQNYPDLKKELMETFENVRKQFIALDNYERVCILHNCSYPRPRVAKRSVRNDLLRNNSLVEEIRIKLYNLVQYVTRVARAKIRKIFDNYSRRINIVFENMHAAVEKYFGHEMYDIMKLQQDIGKLDERLNVDEFELNVDGFKENLYVLRGKLITLTRLVKEYGYYCDNCKRASRDDSDLNSFSRRSFNSDNSSVDELIKKKANDVLVMIDMGLLGTFYQIGLRINKLEHLDSYLEPARAKIGNMTQVERETLDVLQNKVPPSAILQFISLLSDVKQYLQRVEDVIERIRPQKNDK